MQGGEVSRVGLAGHVLSLLPLFVGHSDKIRKAGLSVMSNYMIK